MVDLSTLTQEQLDKYMKAQLAGTPTAGASFDGARRPPSSFPPRPATPAMSPEGERARANLGALPQVAPVAAPTAAPGPAGAGAAPSVMSKLKAAGANPAAKWAGRAGGVFTLGREAIDVAGVALDPNATKTDVAVQTAGGVTKVGGMMLGAKAGGMGGAAIGAATGPAAPVAVPVLATLGALGGGALGYWGAGEAADAGARLAGYKNGLPGNGTSAGSVADQIMADPMATAPVVAPAPAPAPAPASAPTGQVAPVYAPGQGAVKAATPRPEIPWAPPGTDTPDLGAFGSYMNMMFGAANSNLIAGGAVADRKAADAAATAALAEQKLAQDLGIATLNSDTEIYKSQLGALAKTDSKAEVKILPGATGENEAYLTDPGTGKVTKLNIGVQQSLLEDKDNPGTYYVNDASGKPRLATPAELAQARAKGAIK